jgi:tetratricopeptide (TPR) repeat protein
VFERAGLPGRAVEAYERALTIPQKEGPVSPGSFASAALRAEAIRALALLARRARRYDDAAAHWRQLLEMPECPLAMAREASEALAIHHEHRTRDFDAAHEFAVRTIGLGRRSARGRDVFYRLARIDRKRAAVQHVRPNPFGELPFA